MKDSDELIGCLSLGLNKNHKYAEIGYWIGKEYWNHGYCTEASQALIDYGFSHMNINKIMGRHFASNPASGKIMEKCTMKVEGLLEQSLQKGGLFHDVVYYGLLRSDWLKKNKHIQFIDLEIKQSIKYDVMALENIQNKAFLENGKIIGGADIRYDGNRKKCRLARIYIDPNYQNIGIGQRIMEILESKYSDVTEWTLDTPYLNYRNQYFYEKLGYIKDGLNKIDDTFILIEYKKIK